MGITVIEQKAAAGENLSVIRRAKPKTQAEIKKKRVAAYCRVSKNIEEQETSIRTQMESYNQIIQDHPDWELAGIYADKKTGTNVVNRPEFQQMIQDAKDGKIDMILAKSASRFARNTVDLLSITRELRELGVGVFFEKEKLNTLSLQTEMYLTVNAAFAQEESHSVSENMKRGIRQRFQIGIPKWSEVYGLQRIGKDEWAPKPGEAEIVVEIFEHYLSGKGAREIIEILEKRRVPAPGGGKNWHKSSVLDIVNNEKYAGDCLMQKYYTKDHLSHKNVKNKGAIVDQYYKESHHEALVPRDYYEDAVRVTLMKDSHRGTIQYPYYGRLKCPFCGNPMVKVRMPSGRNTNGWVCGGEEKGILYTERTDCKPYWIKEPYLSKTVKRAIMDLDPWETSAEVVDYLRKAKKELKDGRQIEFMDLKVLVESITFPDWETMEITWTWGKKTTTMYCVTGFSDYPDPTIRIVDGDLAIGKKRVSEYIAEKVEQSTLKAREAILNTRIYSDDSKRFSLPPVVNNEMNKAEMKEGME